ncbi:KIF21 [Mytilus coruscus]|uniref:KIF21 n=1 Tax=Mytilus coruscus TaxID=42192 RepID=A0A6J8C8D9_MYTCO|nr:KIF21 [Mytilus coruscus]
MKNEDVQKQSADEMRGRITLNGMCAASALQILKGLKERQQLTQSGVENGLFYNSLQSPFKKSDLEFLDTNWKENYSETEWDRIKLFEWNFQNSVSTKNRVQFESLIEKKYNFYELCKSVQENAETIGPIVVKTMKKNFARKTASNALQGNASQNEQNYSGITQDMNTDELLVNYHSVSTVFDVISHLGITQSQKTGDRRLKVHADPEMCYFFTFLKQYPLIYRNVEENEESVHSVSIKQCHLALLMDNLGICRSKQIRCLVRTELHKFTLPLTIKGIPRDSFQVQNWHSEECDGTNECICKEVKVLQKTDLNRTFLELYPEEEHVYSIFKQEATWPIYDLWEDLQMNNLITESQQAKENMESNLTETSIDQLNLTLESVHLNDEELNMSIEDLDRSMGSLSVGSQMDRDEVSSQMGTSTDQLNGSLTIPTDEENTVEHNIFRHIEDISISGLENIEDSEDKDLESPNLSAIDSDSDTLSLGMNMKSDWRKTAKMFVK